MDYNSLRYYVTLYEQRSFLAAADCIPMTVQGLRKAIRLLEDELGVDLYARGREQLLFTEAGEVLYQFCVNELVQYQGLLEKLDELRKGKRSVVSIVFSIGSYGLFASKIQDMMYDRISCDSISLLTQPESEIVKGLRAGYYDFGINQLIYIFKEYCVCFQIIIRNIIFIFYEIPYITNIVHTVN